MQPETWPQIAGIGSIAAGFGMLVWKIFVKQAELTDKVINVIQDHSEAMKEQAVASTQLSEAVKSLGQNIQTNTSVTNASKEAINTLLTHLPLPR